ncbi:hypothetical protein OIDMADRAFT_184659 [Oidiodendron maius Zn]|uniref:Xylanolytic transcriptional activator regulatory domain-containing protein n=1 Tax=Oidiodendron maius (strain Zn) TaxID=913774 RepID=A0A0C3GQS8_OIDMZ|nr:hypothetical protein OIDMADRAFT_184659 [Oidiodendron maius Zn]
MQVSEDKVRPPTPVVRAVPEGTRLMPVSWSEKAWLSSRRAPGLKRQDQYGAFHPYASSTAILFHLGRRTNRALGRLEAELQKALEVGAVPPEQGSLVPLGNGGEDDVALPQNPMPRTHKPIPSTSGGHKHPVPVSSLEKTSRLTEREPAADLLFSLTSLYFHHIHPWLPFLDTQRVLADMGSEKRHSYLYYALFGASLPFSRDPRLDQISCDSYWTFSKRHILIDILEEPSFRSLEALTVLAIDLSGMTNGPQVWGPMAVAVKFAKLLNPVKNYAIRTSALPDPEISLSHRELIYRRRLFWAIYALDSYITITTGHPSDLTDDYVYPFLATRETTWKGSQITPTSFVGDSRGKTYAGAHDFAAATPTLVFYHQLKLLDISRRLHVIRIRFTPLATDASSTTTLQWVQNFLECSGELFRWFHSLPPCLLPNWEADPQIMSQAPACLLMLHGYYHGLVLHLHGLAAYPPDKIANTNMSQHTYESRQACMHSIELLVMIATTANEKAYDKLGWTLTWSIWLAMRYLLLRNRREGLYDMEAFYILLKFLEKLGKYWQIGTKYWQLLRQASAEFKAIPGLDRSLVPLQVLDMVTDLQIPSSDLEDRCRPDPVLQAATEITNPATNDEFQGIVDTSQDQGIDDPLTENAYLGFHQDTWFQALLFPSPGYQQ